ncbi:N-acyl amino acid synthase FeeM domain-containing protein [Thiocystis violascens]|uniref:N-acyl amino acid synthase FeeM catalytic core domain-containing protein n=1 Tax=Thiocystis violascens (strain ATCC 17096 / DSM 198 / 6111) TaxID=765911 RepID=I3YGH0_THIV6|nr:GNAT family N-acetyltransferase [Thiocystis violascens]AFL76088.1 hypothetical protein Thivi_4275 [Thiocystis violascens DSM 198]
MAIQLKVACSPQEIDDALWLRHHVYVTEEGLYEGKNWPDQRIVDRFDVIPKVAHILAYDRNTPVGGIRLNCETRLGLPPERYFDFRFHLRSLAHTSIHHTTPPIIASGGMLAVRKGWRQRRDVILAIYRVAAGVFFSWDVTRIIATVSHKSASMYHRMGFVSVADQIWNPEIGDHIVPIMADAKNYYRWAFGESQIPINPIWQERRRSSCDDCHRLIIEDPPMTAAPAKFSFN